MSHSHKHHHPKKEDEKPEEEVENPKAEPAELKKITLTEQEWNAVKEELAEYKDKYLRLLADMENSRKRMQKERQELTQYAIEQVIADFLHPLDNLENALKFAEQASTELRNWAAGFNMILGQFRDVLANQGVTAVKSIDTIFDPNVHEAVENIETDDKAPGTIVEECVKGYKIGDRTIRPARVKVAKAKQ